MSRRLVIVVLCALILFAIPVSSVNAAETLLWSDNISSGGTTLSSPTLMAGKEYRIEVKEIFWYNFPANLAADAMYYTDDGSDHWQWVNHKAELNGHSFVQINGLDVDWGPFSNGDTGHIYSITYVGAGVAITFQIIDWIDGDYTNNGCHLPVAIYELPSPGLSPGYWKHEFKTYYEGKGKPHNSWETLLDWTEKIDDYWGVTPPAFDGYALPPVSSCDTDGDGEFTTDDAYTILRNVKQYKNVWLGVANWYNWASGLTPYFD